VREIVNPRVRDVIIRLAGQLDGRQDYPPILGTRWAWNDARLAQLGTVDPSIAMRFGQVVEAAELVSVSDSGVLAAVIIATASCGRDPDRASHAFDVSHRQEDLPGYTLLVSVLNWRARLREGAWVFTLDNARGQIEEGLPSDDNLVPLWCQQIAGADAHAPWMFLGWRREDFATTSYAPPVQEAVVTP